MIANSVDPEEMLRYVASHLDPHVCLKDPLIGRWAEYKSFNSFLASGDFFVCWSGVNLGFLERGFICIKVSGYRFDVFFSFFLNISPRPNYFIFIGYIKTGAGRGFQRTP